MKTLKFLLAKTMFDLYLFKKPIKYYTKLDWFLNQWCLTTFSEYKRYVKEEAKNLRTEFTLEYAPSIMEEAAEIIEKNLLNKEDKNEK